MKEILGYALIVISMSIAIRAVTGTKSSGVVVINSAYCVTCKTNVEFASTVYTSDSGRSMAKGVCSTCKSAVYRVLGKQ